MDGFPNIGLQGFAPKLAKGEIVSLSGVGDDARYFQISVVLADGHHAAGQSWSPSFSLSARQGPR